MTKKEHIAYWLTNSERDWKRAERCFRDRDYVFCLFCVHLSLEKICKAAWVKDNKGNYPPRIHNLEKLLRQTKIELDDEDWNVLINLNPPAFARVPRVNISYASGIIFFND